MRKSPFRCGFASVLCVLAALSATPGAALAAADTLVDRILAVVDEDPILASDVDLVIGLGFVTRGANEDDRTLRRRALDGLIEQRLRFQQVDRYGFTELPADAIDGRFAEIVASLGGPEALRGRLAALQLTEAALRQMVAQQLLVLTYVEERLGARVFVGLDEIKTYYDAILGPELSRSGQPVPPIEEVRERIRGVLKEQRLNQELETWTEELRREADIVDHFDEERRNLPALRWEAPAKPGG